MKDGQWWVVHDPEQGHSSQVRDFAEALQGTLKKNVAVISVSHTSLQQSEAPEGVVLWCALKWYLTNRHSIAGRPWVGALSWCFDDLMSVISDKALPGINLIDAGLNALWTNCPAYVQQTSSAYRCNFSLKPLNKPGVYGSVRRLMGVVLPSVADRDYSQLAWTLRYLKSLMVGGYDVDGPRIYMRKDETMRLPDAVLKGVAEDNIVHVEPVKMDNLYSEFIYCVVPPRITDLRGGVVSPEIYQALLSGCLPLVITHPVWAQQLKGINLTTYDSLKQYSRALGIAVSGSRPEIESLEYRNNFTALRELHTGLAHKVTKAYQEATSASAGQPIN